jgi:hypothetical protein
LPDRGNKLDNAGFVADIEQKVPVQRVREVARSTAASDHPMARRKEMFRKLPPDAFSCTGDDRHFFSYGCQPTQAPE